MALTDYRVDRETRRRLGKEQLREVVRHLWPGDCQACGRALGNAAPSVCVDDLVVTAAAGLYHADCRAPVWNDSGNVPTASEASISWAACTLLLPLTAAKGGGAPATDERPMLLVNPSLEMVPLTQTDHHWRASPYGRYTAAGLAPPGGIDFRAPIPSATARITGDDLSVTIATPAAETYAAGVAPHQRRVLDRARQTGGCLLGITQALIPGADLTPHALMQVFQTGDLVSGWVALS